MTCCAPKQKDAFYPNYKEVIITEKFYARHDLLSATPERVQFYINELERRERINLHSTYSVPITENQVYGWLEEKAFKYEDDFDRDIQSRPKNADELMKVLQEIAYEMHKKRAVGQ